MNKRGQNWSVEMIITATLFVTFFVTFISVSYVATNNDLRQTEIASDELSSRLLSQTDKASIVDSRNAINQSRLLELSDLTYAQLKELMGESGNFCIILEDERGEIIPINNKYGIGSDEILVNGVACDGAIS